MSKRINITGKTFNYLTVIKHLELHNWLCLCICGKEKIAKSVELRTGHIQSCGCKKGELISKKKTLHGKTKRGTKHTHLYQTWLNIRSRCYAKYNNRYKWYGGKGVTVCVEWKDDYIAFEKYILSSLGDHPGKGYSLDRIEVNGNYEPGNVKWSTDKEQSLNKTTSKYLTINNKTHNLTEWSNITGIKYSTLMTRLCRGWAIEDVLNIPTLTAFNGFKKHPDRKQ